ncbi:MAG TPA: aminopeptidase P family N-terminal domain-containing protein, partial [Gemmatimonadaceae bacterium]
MTDRRRERLAALGRMLAQERIDALLLTSLPNIRYLTGFSGTSALALATEDEIRLLTDFRYELQVAEEVGDVATIRIEAVSLWTGLWDILGKLSTLEVIGFESAHIYHRDFQRLLSDGSRWQWRPQLNLVETLRESKDADEVALIREAARIATDALTRTVPQVRAGQSELEIAG